MGRSAVITKRRYYLRAQIRGLLGAQIVSTIALAALALTVWLSPNRDMLRTDLQAAAGRMLNGIWSAVLWETRVLGLLILGLMLGLENALNRQAAREQSVQLDAILSVARNSNHS